MKEPALYSISSPHLHVIHTGSNALHFPCHVVKWCLRLHQRPPVAEYAHLPHLFAGGLFHVTLAGVQAVGMTSAIIRPPSARATRPA